MSTYAYSVLTIDQDTNGDDYRRYSLRVLDDAQTETVEGFKADLAAWFVAPGSPWEVHRASLIASGVPEDDAEEVLLQAVESLVEDGWDDYR